MIAGRPRVLVVDDDPVSLRFLGLALDQAGAVPFAAVDGDAARTLAQTHEFDLLLIDRRLDGIDGPDLLCELRELGVRAAAIATSAEIATHDRESLLGAGFIDTLSKPATLAAVCELMARHAGSLPIAAPVAPHSGVVTDPVLDDAGALAAIGGDAAALTALRRLFAGEIDGLLAGLAAAPRDALSGRLHRFRASCGFCGARALAAAAAQLQRALESDAEPQDARQAFLAACASVRAELARHDPSLAAP